MYIIEYFKNYVSNTVAGSGTQMCFESDGKPQTGRLFYKITKGGEYDYSFLYTNIADGTFDDGSVSHKNLVFDSWNIISLRAAVCKNVTVYPNGDNFIEYSDGEFDIGDFTEITFGGKPSKTVTPAEYFVTDPIRLSFNDGEYLCLEITFCGKELPQCKETVIPAFRLIDGEWINSSDIPFPSMIGCQRAVKKKIAYLGDSITQGLGTVTNSYSHWNAVVSEKLGDEYAFWNLGLGFGRADDAASDGTWLFKAKQNDIVVLCYGVNDTIRGFSADEIKNNLKKIVDKLNERNIKVIIQTVPPFDYTDEKINIWNDVNTYIKQVLSKETAACFDVVPILGADAEHPYNTVFGGHPNAEGCRLWGEALTPVIEKVIK